MGGILALAWRRYLDQLDAKPLKTKVGGTRASAARAGFAVGFHRKKKWQCAVRCQAASRWGRSNPAMTGAAVAAAIVASCKMKAGILVQLRLLAGEDTQVSGVAPQAVTAAVLAAGSDLLAQRLSSSKAAINWRRTLALAVGSSASSLVKAAQPWCKQAGCPQLLVSHACSR